MLATHKGMITLIDRNFGRGTDFICEDENIDRQGGMIAIQSEYHLILNAEELKNNYDYDIP